MASAIDFTGYSTPSKKMNFPLENKSDKRGKEEWTCWIAVLTLSVDWWGSNEPRLEASSGKREGTKPIIVSTPRWVVENVRQKKGKFGQIIIVYRQVIKQ